MASITERKKPLPPYVQPEDPDIVKNDPILSRAAACFDMLRHRGVGPERAARCVDQFLGNPNNGGSHPTPSNSPR